MAKKKTSARAVATTSVPSSSRQQKLALDTPATDASPTLVSNARAKKDRQQSIKDQRKAKPAENARAGDPAIDQLLRDLAKDTDLAKIDATILEWRTTDVESLPAVQLETTLEHELIDLLKPLYIDSASKVVSEYTLSKLPESKIIRRINYNRELLQKLDFNAGQVDSAMRKVPPWDLGELLDWLCLTLNHEELPREFADKFYFETSQRVISARKGGDKSKATDVQLTDDEASRLSTTVLYNKQDTSNDMPIDQAIKERILAQYSYEDEEQSNDKDIEQLDGVESLSTTTKDPNRLHADFRFTNFEQKNKYKASAITASRQARTRKKLHALESHLKFDKRTAEIMYKALIQQQIATTKQQTISNASLPVFVQRPVETTLHDADNENDIEPTFDIFDDTSNRNDTTTSTQDLSNKTSQRSTIVAVREMPITGWTGKVPKQLLQDTLRREDHYVRLSYSEIQSPRGVRAQCTVTPSRSSPVVFRMQNEACTTKQEAEHYAAVFVIEKTMALFHFADKRPLHRMLPPVYRDLWLEWDEHCQDNKSAVKAVKDEERAKFLLDIWNVWKQNSEVDVNQKVDAEHAQEQYNTRRMRKEGNNNWDKAILQDYGRRQQTTSYKKLLSTRMQLPVYQHREEIIRTIRDNQVVLICGETGSGKSTQVSQFILEDMIQNSSASTCSIICTQPRRISALSIATRVSREMGDRDVGGDNSWVGYSVRLESRATDHTRLLFCTTGILLRRMESDLDLYDVSHIVVDEIHERSLDSDFLLMLLRHTALRRPNLKIILMSATLEADKFSNYFGRCPLLNIPGRMFDVQVSFLEDIVRETGYVIEESSEYARRTLIPTQRSIITVTGQRGKKSDYIFDWDDEEAASFPEDDSPSLLEQATVVRQTLRKMNPLVVNYELIERLLEHICLDNSTTAATEGAVLLFLPGLMEIRTCIDMLNRHPVFGNSSQFLLLPLHSSLTNEQQSAVFQIPENGIRKVVCSTDIAETGVTIPDIVFVVDSGKVKETRYDESRHMTKFEEVFVSQANAKQRRGRAGRVRPGNCYHLFSSYRFKHQLQHFRAPEVHRVPLDSTCLKIKVYQLGSIVTAFNDFLEPPAFVAVNKAIERLVRVQALHPEDEKLTALGQHLGNLPVDVELGKLLLFGAILKCLDPAITIAACLSHKSPFVRPFGMEEEADRAKSKFISGNSDLFTMYTAYRAWRVVYEKSVNKSRAFCSVNYLSYHNLVMIEEIKKQFLQYLVNIKFVQLSDKTNSLKQSNKFMSLCYIPAAYDQQNRLPVFNLTLTAAFYPNLLQQCIISSGSKGKSDIMTLRTTTDAQVFIHPSSIHHSSMTNPQDALMVYKSPWFIYYLRMKSTSGKVHVWDATNVDGLAVVLMAGFASMDVNHTAKYVTLDGAIRVKCFAKTAVVLRKLRQQMDAIFDRLINEPDAVMTGLEQKILDMLVKVVEADPMYSTDRRF